ncbi:ABC transporter substrate-binding protein, partial [Helicobacter pylori]
MNNVFVKGLFFFLFLFGFFLKASENPNATLNPSKENVSVGEQKRFGGVLVFARGADGSSMDPALVTDGESYVATGNIYDTLVQFKYGTTEIEPALATSWEISPDGLVYTFHLRKGVYFHQTKYWNKKVEFSAKDVLFSFERQMHKAKRYYSPGAKSYKYWEGMGMSHIIKSIEALDDYT